MSCICYTYFHISMICFCQCDILFPIWVNNIHLIYIVIHICNILSHCDDDLLYSQKYLFNICYVIFYRRDKFSTLRRICFRPRHILYRPRQKFYRLHHIPSRPRLNFYRPHHILDSPRHNLSRPRRILDSPRHIPSRPQHNPTT